MEDLKNSYLNEQGLRQEIDALRVENARLMDAHAEDMRLFTASMDALRAQVAELRGALKPFASISCGIDDEMPIACEDRWWQHDGEALYGRDFRRARAALEMSGGVK